MSLGSFVRSLLISFLVAIPAPFVFQGLAAQGRLSDQWAVFLTTCLLAFIGCLVMGLGTGESGRDESVAGDEGDNDRETGTVKWFNASKGFGFITRASGEDVFVHYRSIRGNGRRALKDGQRVRFKVVQGEKGLQAEDVSPAS